MLSRLIFTFQPHDSDQHNRALPSLTITIHPHNSDQHNRALPSLTITLHPYNSDQHSRALSSLTFTLQSQECDLHNRELSEHGQAGPSWHRSPGGERGVEKGRGRHSTLRGRERCMFNQTNTDTVSRATEGRLPRDGAKRVRAFPSATMPS